MFPIDPQGCWKTQWFNTPIDPIYGDMELVSDIYFQYGSPRVSFSNFLVHMAY